jgi:ABC-type Fe3+ transport system substrate-binding protein
MAAAMPNALLAADERLPSKIAALLPAAQAEGNAATIYGLSLDPGQVAAFSQRMSAFYGTTFTLTMVSGLHPQKVAELAQSARMGVKSGLDLFWTGSAIAVQLEKAALVAQFDWTQTYGLDPSLSLGPNGLRLHDGDLGAVIMNTQLVPSQEAPTSYLDLPKNQHWTGKIALPRAPDVFVYIAYALGDPATRELIKGVVDTQRATILSTYPEVRNRVIAGEFAIGMGQDAVLMVRRGAPVARAPIDPLLLTPWGAYLMKDAAHPATAQLFAYWGTTSNGQKAMSDINGVSMVTTPGTELAKMAEGKKVLIVPDDYVRNELPKLVPPYAKLMGVR